MDGLTRRIRLRWGRWTCLEVAFGVQLIVSRSQVAGISIYPTCASWYLGSNVPGKPRVFMPLLGYPPYKVKCDEVRANNYEGCVLA